MILIYPFPCFRLSLTKGPDWLIRAGDQEAARVVAAFADAMALAPVSPENEINQDEEWREIRVFVEQDWKGPVVDYSESELVFCRLPQPKDNYTFVICMSLIGLTIVRAELSRGGALIHGALAEVPASRGEGCILLVGAGTVGKTTASSRLPLPWRSLTDDASLVVRSKPGHYRAHPWPTWSRFLEAGDGKSGPGGTWDVQLALDLRAVFFLARSKKDRVEPLGAASGAACLLETVQHVSHPMTLGLPSDQIQVINRQILSNVEAIVHSTPSYSLHLSLTGSFWEKIEEVLSTNRPNFSPQQQHSDIQGATLVPINSSLPGLKFSDSTLSVGYSGPSMNPTLCHPDVLEVLPYAEQNMKRGDVIYFRPPADDLKTVHRIVRITPTGITTRGDNNSADDPYRIKPEEIIGRVIAAWRFGKRRTIAGGRIGIWVSYWYGVRFRLNRFFSFLLHGTYRRISTSGSLLSILPAALHPRVYEFKNRNSPSTLKLVVKGRVIGHFDVRTKQWLINRPWRLVIDETKLPIVSRQFLKRNSAS